MSESFSADCPTSHYSSFQQLHTLEGGAVYQDILWAFPFALTPDSQRLITVELHKTLKIWDFQQGLLQVFLGDRQTLSHAQFLHLSPDGKRCYILYHERPNRYEKRYYIEVKDISTGEIFNTIESKQDWIDSIVVSPDEKLLTLSNPRKGFEVWDLQAKHKLYFQPIPPSRYLRHFTLQFSLDGQLLLYNVDGKTQIYKSYSGTQLYSILWEDGGNYRPIHICADRTTAIGLDYRGFIQQWELTTGGLIQRWQLPNPEVSKASFFSSDGVVLCGVFKTGEIKIWNWKTGELLNTLYCPTYHQRGYQYYSIQTVQFTRDNQFMLTSGTDYTIRIWGNTQYQSCNPPFRYDQDMHQRRSDREQRLLENLFRGAFND
ncbi:WD40 repeat domain-containing protein [Roseofilum reptotaenium CS-1145]|uniref:Anaphase-promoting complex subunit 4 WD40 domain-containing protein n=1 Tax=Roseofilum reptotaenium AO1-A TaxID=1925591 RepID=A0A1L9QU56_9CYAN|nr:WD40 repeat domain-containing protein [Roseofilum reptotaenium]MDB9517377.1 WD40 repeat domain-containing protein [Roseofilum reptotaenium CS-1145]OJJ26201.1 hypothetical protein BI308_07295 [Roseofilum reptotaenium AO1-A]